MAPRTRKPSTLALTVRVGLLSGIASVVLLAGLVWQMVAGADPALQPAQASSGSAAATTALSGTAGGTTQSAPAPVVSAPTPVTSSTS